MSAQYPRQVAPASTRSDSASRVSAAPPVGDVVERRRVRAERDDVLVRGLPVVLRGRPEIEKVQAQLRQRRRRETRHAALRAPRGRAGSPRRCRRSRRGSWSLRSASRAFRSAGGQRPLPRMPHERRALGPRRRTRRVPSPASGFTSAGLRTVATSKTLEVCAALGRRAASPRSSAMPSARSFGLRPGRNDERAVGLCEGQPVLAVRHGPERPVLVVEGTPLEERPRMDYRPFPAVDRGKPRERVRVASLEVGHVAGVEAIELPIDVFRRSAHAGESSPSARRPAGGARRGTAIVTARGWRPERSRCRSCSPTRGGTRRC